MLSQPATKIFFKTSEPRAAKWISETLGEVEVERLKESRTPKLIGSRKSFSLEIATKPLIMASEIAGLEPLQGYIKQENRVVPVRFAYVEKRSLQPAFIERKMTIHEPRPLPSVVVSEIPLEAVPLLKTIQAPTPKAAPMSPTPQVPQIAATTTVSTPEPQLPLFAEAISPDTTQPKPRRSAFKKRRGEVPEDNRDWDERRLVD